MGNHSYQTKDDYPDYASVVAQKVSKNKKAKGILLCGNGVGVCVVANKYKGIRAVNAQSVAVAQESRADDDTNILCLGGRHISFVKAKKIIDVWLKTKLKKNPKYKRRINKIKRLESKK